MNELEVCEHCRPKYDVGTDTWWPADCTQCTARFRPQLCEHICSWIFEEMLP